jgi:hypothetical protein
MKIKFISSIFFFFFALILSAQNFLDGSFTFSSKKESYITLNDGKEIVGFIDDIDRKKGLIEEIVIKDQNKKKIKLKPEDVKHMYIAPSGFDKFMEIDKKLNDLTEWTEDQSKHNEFVKKGYVFFETTDVMLKKKKMTLLLQLLNPGFAKKLKVYFDPYASETMSVGIGGITVAGGDAKSYYFKKGDAPAFLMKKKNYDEEFENLYGDCPDLKKEFAKKMGWGNVEKHVYYHSENCK